MKVDIIALDRFIQATRDSGYKSTISAVSELIDNSVQAGAKRIEIRITNGSADEENPLEVAVVDDGSGMDRSVLWQALRFGGTTRFDDRSGLGRYGMGLPNASLSQARRVEVFTWQGGAGPIATFLDVDEIAAGNMTEVPSPRRQALPAGIDQPRSESGTLVYWRRCDRLDHRRVSTLERKLLVALGRIFRHFLWSGRRISVNGETVQPVDPLFVREPSRVIGGRHFGEPSEFAIRVPASNGTRPRTGKVVVTFSELPIHEWHNLPNVEKRRRGVADGAGVSVVRAGREIDYAWFFMGSKRRENYDDWWRCEVSFDPVLDEAFGITHTKQQIRPKDYLLEALVPTMEETARALNARARKAYQSLKARGETSRAESVASTKDSLLPPLPRRRATDSDKRLARQLNSRHPGLGPPTPTAEGGTEFRIVEDDLGHEEFFRPVVEEGRVTVVLNPRHRFYRRFYEPLKKNGPVIGQDAAELLQLCLIAASRAEASFQRANDVRVIEDFRREWSAVLQVLLST